MCLNLNKLLPKFDMSCLLTRPTRGHEQKMNTNHMSKRYAMNVPPPPADFHGISKEFDVASDSIECQTAISKLMESFPQSVEDKVKYMSTSQSSDFSLFAIAVLPILYRQ